MKSEDKMEKKQAVIYARVSTKDQVENFSLGTQEKLAREYCLKSGWEVVKVFREEGESAKTVNRPKFKEMLEYCSKNKDKVGYVVVHSLSRFARKADGHFSIRAVLWKFNITLRSVTEPIDDSSEGKLFEGIFASIHEYDNNIKIDRTKTGMKAAMEAGRWPFVAPLGYLNSRTKNGPSLFPDPVMGGLIRTGFELCSTGSYSIQSVLDKVTALGLKSKGNQKLTPQSFGTLLRNPIYYGLMVVEKWNMRVMGDFKPLISKELFDKVQLILEKKGHAYISHKVERDDFPLKRFVRCSHCGKPLTGSYPRGRKKHYGYYTCWNPECRTVKARKEVLEGKFTSLLNSLAPTSESLILFKKILLEVYADRQANRTTLLKELESKKEILKGKKGRLIEEFVYQKSISKEAYQYAMEQVENQIDDIERQMGELLLDYLDVAELTNLADKILSDPLRVWEKGDLNQKARLQNAFFPEGISYDGEKLGTAKRNLIFNVIDGISSHQEEVAPRVQPSS